MSDRNIELTRRKVLGGLASIGAASAAAGAGTMAYFNDEETSSGNSVSAGTIDLTLGNSGNATVTVSDTKPGQSGGGTTSLTNQGSLPADLELKVGNIQESPGSNSANDLAQYIDVSIGYSTDGDHTTSTDNTEVVSGTLDTISTSWTDAAKSLSANGGTTNLYVTWSFNETNAPQNAAQGDSLTFDVEARLVQQ